jgi:hypothetical protein
MRRKSRQCYPSALADRKWSTLDIVFREDECQIYAEDGARNLATMRCMLLNMVKADPLKV